MLMNKYEIISNISKGEFGKVLKASYNDKLYAIKYGACDVIKYELEIYKQLRYVSNISSIYDVFEYNNNMYMVLDLYNMTLLDYKSQNYNNENYIEGCFALIKDLITLIQSVHKYNIIHRDLKPSNICIDSNNNLCLIDFGLSKVYKYNNVHNPETKINALIGSINYSSLNVINLISPSRRDDIESIMYILFYLIINKITYQIYDTIDSIEKKNIAIIIKFLQDSAILNKNSINYIVIEKAFNYVRRLKYNQEPNYEYVINLIMQGYG
jgi:serine/threonine protein kinase